MAHLLVRENERERAPAALPPVRRESHPHLRALQAHAGLPVRRGAHFQLEPEQAIATHRPAGWFRETNLLPHGAPYERYLIII